LITLLKRTGGEEKVNMFSHFASRSIIG